MFGLLAAILLSFLLSKTITTPIERITEGARSIAKGNFDQELGVQSSDEIGELTRSFNYMAGQLKEHGRRGAGRTRQAEHLVPAYDGRRSSVHDRGPAHPYESGDRKPAGRAGGGRPDIRRNVRRLDMPNSDGTAMRSFLTSEITRFGRVLSGHLAPYGALDRRAA